MTENIPDENGMEVVVKSQVGEPQVPAEPRSAVENENLVSAEDEEPIEEAAEAEIAEDMQPRLERLGGEPAPDITPEEFARLQQSGQIHIDPRGRVRSTRVEEDAGVSLRKRRAWYL
jgi:hypothetical protein